MASSGDEHQIPDTEIVDLDDDPDGEAAERDGLASLHDVEAESGDEEGLGDDYDIDEREAREAGVALDPVAPQERELD